MSSERARRWWIGRESTNIRRNEILDGPLLDGGEKVEVVEVSALRAEWEEELLSAPLIDVLVPELAERFRGQLRTLLAAIKEERDRG
jgi:hypothetical protein